ncbi:hypothetical protein BRADI_2g17830v3, partial [Brachypodium distachyon]
MADDAAGMSGRRLTRLRTLGRGSSGAVVSLFAADGELLAVKSAATGGAAQLRREGGILASLCSPYVLPCLGSRAAAGGEYQLLLEFAPGGSLADEVARNGGRLEEPAVRAYAGHVARGLAYLHGESMVHGDVKARNVVIGADGWAKLADFGCARRCPGPGPGPILGGTPAFMAPEVARGEEQGPAADVWALGCIIIEMATGRAPWADMDAGCGAADVISAVRRIGYTDAVPEAPERMSPDAKDFLDKCLRRSAGERWTAAQLLEHPFLLAPVEQLKARWVSPKSTLDAAMWEESDDADEDVSLDDDRTAERMKALAKSCSVLPDWELSDDDGWIDVWSSSQSEFTDSTVASPAPEKKASSGDLWDKILEAEVVVQPEVFDAAAQVAAPSEETTKDVSFLEEMLILEAEIGVVQASVLEAAMPSGNDAGFRDEGLVGLAEMDDGAEAFDTGRRVVGDELVQNVGVASVDDQQHNVG